MVREADVIFIAVDTPQGEDGSADLSNVAEVARDIGGPWRCRGKQGAPAGGGQQEHGAGGIRGLRLDAHPRGLRGGRRRKAGEAAFLVASNPEFLREGSAIYDSLCSRTGSWSAPTPGRRLDTLRALYEPIIEQSFPTEMDPRPKVAVPFVTTDLASAEMIKYASNAFLATKISFINEIANLCELVGADVTEVAHGIGLDERIGRAFSPRGSAGAGRASPRTSPLCARWRASTSTRRLLLDATVAVNERQRKQVIAKLQRELHTLKGKRIALLGLSFKPNTDDLREAPSLQIARSLDSLGARVVGYDPVAGKKAAARRLPSLKVVFDPYEALWGPTRRSWSRSGRRSGTSTSSVRLPLWRSPKSSWTGATPSIREPPRGAASATGASGVARSLPVAKKHGRWLRAVPASWGATSASGCSLKATAYCVWTT